MTGLAAILGALVASAGCVTSTSGGPQVEASPSDAAVANVQLGVAYMRKGDLELAHEKLSRAVTQDPNLPSAHTYYAFVLDQLGQTDDASTHYERAIRLAPDDPVIHNLYGAFLCRHERIRQGEKHFAAAARNPRYRTPEAALTNAGVCVLKRPDADAAEAYFRQALDRNPRYPEALWQLAALSFQEGRYLQSRAFLERFGETSEPSAASLWLAVQVERELGDSSAAGRFEQTLIDRFPESVETRLLLEERGGG